MQFDATFYVLIALCGFALYLLIVQLLYWYRMREQERLESSKERTVDILLISASALIFIVGILQVIRRHVVAIKLTEFENNIFYTVGVVVYIITVTIIYSVIWLRQRIIYTTPALCHLTNKYSRFLSKYMILVIIVHAPIESAAIAVIYNLQICIGDCITKLFYSLIIPGTTITQGVLLYLLVHPLLKHHKTNVVTDDRYVSLMRRLGIATTICLISDVTSILFDRNWIEYIPLQVNLVVNFVCVILPTTNWKCKLFPCPVTLDYEAKESIFAKVNHFSE